MLDSAILSIQLNIKYQVNSKTILVKKKSGKYLEIYMSYFAGQAQKFL